MKKMDPVVHFEMPAEDGKRMSDFYTNVFGWQTKQLGEENGNYMLVSTTESKEDGSPTQPGRINGGFYPKKEEWPAQYPTVVIAVDDIKESMKRITNAGGKVLGEPMDIPGYGTYVSFYDTEGNRVSIIEPTMEMKEREVAENTAVV